MDGLRVCPKCKFVDPPEWKHSKYSYWIDHCKIDDFKRLEPTLAKCLLNGEKLVEDEDYIYRITKTKRDVERKAKVDYGYQWNIPMEHHDPLGIGKDMRKVWHRELNQRGLFEATTETTTKK